MRCGLNGVALVSHSVTTMEFHMLLIIDDRTSSQRGAGHEGWALTMEIRLPHRLRLSDQGFYESATQEP
jgi:hypothetical protein